VSERWYDEAVIYRLEVESFADSDSDSDSDSDGIGDFHGLMGQLDYLYRCTTGARCWPGSNG